MVQDVDGIHPELELLSFSNLEAFHHVHVEVNGRRPADRALLEISLRSRLRVSQNDVAVRILDRRQVVTSAQAVAGRR